MTKRLFSGIMLALLLTSMLTLAFNIQPVKAQGTIYIRVDGSVEGTDKIVTADNVTYTFIGNIADSIVVERDNIVVDGAGYVLQGTGDGIGIYMDGRSGVTIKNATIRNFGAGVLLEGSNYNSISGNNITANIQYGIHLVLDSCNNTVYGNNITNNLFYGIEAYASSSNNTISGNNITNNSDGISLAYSSDNTISGNVFLNDGLFAYGSYNNVVIDNSVNGKPLVYFENVSDRIVDDAGEVILISCNNITVENLNLSHASVGIALWGTNNTKIAKNNITANERSGIYLGVSSNNTVYGNNIANNGFGIWLMDSSNNNTAYGNNIANNGYGIWLFWYSSNNTVYGNNITANNYRGIWLDSSSNNKIYHNNFINNGAQVYSETSTNVWDDGYPSGGNYWSDYEEKYPDAAEIDGSGIWNTPYVIDVDNQDRYPLMHPSFVLFGDVNGDGTVNILDVILVSKAFGTSEGDFNYDPSSDLNQDGRINVLDMILVAKHFGQHIP